MRFATGILTVLMVLAVAAASTAVLPSAIAYDPLTWAVWGREAAHGTLAISPGSSVFKPLPVAVDALAALLHLPVLTTWATVVRASVAPIALLAYRVGGDVLGRVGGASTVAIVLAVPALAPDWLAGASAEPLEVAAVLAAVAFAWRADRGRLFAALAVLSLLRPEAWPLLVASAGWLVAQRPRSLASMLVVPTVTIAIVASWFLGEYAGSGHLTQGLHRAGVPTQGGPLLTAHPGLAVLSEARAQLPDKWWLLAALAVLVAALLAPRNAAARRVLLLAALGTEWLATVAGMTQLHLSSGDSRYLVVTTTFGAALAGLGAAGPAMFLARRLPRLPVQGLAVGALSAYAAAFVYRDVHAAAPLLRLLDHQQRDLGVAAARVRPLAARCPVGTTDLEVPALSWQLHRPLTEIGLVGPRPQVAFLPGSLSVPAGSVVIERNPNWVVASSCLPSIARS